MAIYGCNNTYFVDGYRISSVVSISAECVSAKVLLEDGREVTVGVIEHFPRKGDYVVNHKDGGNGLIPFEDFEYNWKPYSGINEILQKG
jgi:hypothetical protein